MTETLTPQTKVWQKLTLLEELPEYSTEVGISLTRLMVYLHSGRPDLIDLMPLSTPFYATAFLLWFQENAPREYNFPASWIPDFDYKALDVSYKGELVKCASAKLTKLDVLRWLVHPLLRKNLDLSKEDDCDSLSKFGAATFTSHKQLPLSKEIQQAAAEISEISAPGLAIPLNKIVQWTWRLRPDLQKTFPLKTQQSQASYLLWVLSSGFRELNLGPFELRDFSCESLNEPDSAFPEMTRIAHLAWQAKSEYTTGEDRVASRKAFANWFDKFGSTELNLQRVINKTSPSIDSYEGDPAQIHKLLLPNSAQTNGLNVIGALSGNFGLGEHARTTAMAALEAKIQSSLVNCAWSSRKHNDDDTLSSMFTKTVNYNTSVFIGSVSSFLHQLFPLWEALHKDNYRIYFGAWELEVVPPSDKEQLEYFFDEVWASTGFQYDFMARQVNLPVTYIPLAIRELPAVNFKRFQFGLSERRFLFLYTFDGASGLPRKNPIAAVRAFRTAFPLGTEPVGLVLKTKNIDPFDPAGSVLLEMVKSDTRIKLINAHYSKQETYGLQSVCDAYISLHRSEGFGMTIAEAMLLGKPTIATNYSGNTDFCLPSTCCLVDYELVPIAPGEYRFGDGQKWAEADTECAAAHMRNLFADSELAARLGSAGAEYIRANHSLASVGARIKSRLAEIWAS